MVGEILAPYFLNGEETKYLVSTTGKIYRYKGGELKELKITRSSKGYVKVRISIDGKVYNRNIHRMVAETFIPNPENKPEVNHKDTNKKNNKISNLEWVTRKENADHAYENGLFGKNESFSKSTISNNTCIKICEYLQDTDKTTVEIAKIVNCNVKIVRDIFHRKTWIEISKNYDFSNRKKLNITNIETAEKICSLLSKGNLSSKEISDIVGCKIHVVKDIKRGKTMKHIYEKYK